MAKSMKIKYLMKSDTEIAYLYVLCCIVIALRYFKGFDLETEILFNYKQQVNGKFKHL